MLSEERKKIEIQLDALDLDLDFDDNDSDESKLPSPELCAYTHELFDFGQRKNEMCGVAD